MWLCAILQCCVKSMKYPLVSAWHLVITAGFFVFQVENTLHERHIVILKLFSAKVQKHVGGSNYNQWYIFATTKCSKTPLSNSNVSNKGKSNFELSLWQTPALPKQIWARFHWSVGIIILCAFVTCAGGRLRFVDIFCKHSHNSWSGKQTHVTTPLSHWSNLQSHPKFKLVELAHR